MARKILVAASVAALVALGACSAGDNTAYDTGMGATTGAFATPPATTYPPVGLSVGATTGATTTVDTTVRYP